MCSVAKGSETRRHYSKLMSFAIIINDTAVLKRKNNWLNLFVWGWVNFLGDLNLIWILFRCVFFSFFFSLHSMFFVCIVSISGASAREVYTFSSSGEDVWNNELSVLFWHEPASHIPFILMRKPLRRKTKRKTDCERSDKSHICSTWSILPDILNILCVFKWWPKQGICC